MLSCFPWIEDGNENISPSNVLVASLDICGTIISGLNCSPGIPLTRALFSVTIETLIVCMNGHENVVLHATPSPRERETVTGFKFTAKVFF